MANEIKTSINCGVTNGTFRVRFNASITEDQAVLGAEEGIVFVGTSEEDMPVGDVATNGVLLIFNHSTANFVVYGPKSGGSMIAFGRLNPGAFHYLRLQTGVTLRWAADTAQCKVEMHLLNN